MTTRALLVALLVSAAMLGCERENPVPPDGGPRPDAHVDVDGGIDAGDVDGGVPDDAQIDGGVIRDGGDGGTPCAVDGGTCYACPPATTIEFLEACTGATCEPFPVTTARLPLLRADGTVPPLP